MDKPKGKINLRVKDVGDFVQIELEDNGKGNRGKGSSEHLRPLLPDGFISEIPQKAEVVWVYQL